MDHAIILASGNGLDGIGLENFADTKIGELNQLKRLIITAQRAGITRFTVISNNKIKSRSLLDDKRITSSISFINIDQAHTIVTENSLLLQSNLITTTKVLENFLDSGTESDNNKISVLAEKINSSIVKSDGLLATDVFEEGARLVGALKVKSHQLEDLLKDCDLNRWIKPFVKNGIVELQHLKEGYWFNLHNDNESKQEAEKLIFSNVGKTATGWIARNINGRVSIPVSKLLVKTPLTPNMVSVLINVIGVLCGPFYALGHPVIGAIFMQLATILDRCDGEVARVKLMETKRGQWVDTISDQFTVFSFIIGVTIGYYREVNNPIIIFIGLLNVCIFFVFLAWTFYFLKKYTDSGSLVSYFEVDKIVDKKKSTFVRKFIAFLRPLGRRNVYSAAFLIFAIIGGYPLVLSFLTVALIMFLLHIVEDFIKIKRLRKHY